MRGTTAIMIVLAAAMAAIARVQPPVVPGRRLRAYLIDTRADYRHGLYCAEALASRIFAAGGLELSWRTGLPAATPALSELTFVITVADQTPADRKPGAMALALAYEGVHLTVYYDRVTDLAKFNPDPVLGHVFVHEITHLLQGVDRHSETGLMKARYTSEDAFHMLTRPLLFTQEDISLIHLGIAHRMRAANLVAKSADAATAVEGR